MTGTSGEPRVDDALPPIDAGDGDDTTTAEAGPPASRRDDSVSATRPDGIVEPDPHEHEDRTVRPKMEPPPRPPAPKPAAGAPPSAPVPSTEPSGAVATAPAVAPITQTTEVEPTDITADLGADVGDDAESLDDSITATAPRINHANLMDAAQSGHGMPLVIPGTVEIRSVEPDDMLDETEIRTLPGSPVRVNTAFLGLPAPATAGPVHLPPPRPAAGRPPSISPENEDDDDGVTELSLAPTMVPDTPAPSRSPLTQPSAPAPPAPPAPAPPPALAPRAASPRPAAGVPFQADMVEEPPTRPGVEGSLESGEEPATRPGLESGEEPATRPGLGEPATRPGLGEPARHPGKSEPAPAERAKRADVANGYANDGDDDGDESVTARGPVAEPYGDDEESVTQQAAAMPGSVIEAVKNAKVISDPTLDDGTDGTTQRVKKRKPALSSPADGEAESITTQAPGPLTNILRVIASGSSPSLDSEPELPVLHEDEALENRTAVMANAPLKRAMAEAVPLGSSSLPAIRPTGGPLLHGPQGSAAPRLDPSSESGLRVTRAGAVDRASLGPLGVVGDPKAHNGVGDHAKPLSPDGAPLERPQQMNGDVFPVHVQPSVHDVDLGKGPRYGLLVAIVALFSVIVPVSLFFVLHHPGDTAAAPPGVPAEPASEIEKHDGARVKAVRGKNGQLTAPSASASASAAPAASSASAAPAAPSASASSKPSTRGFPFRR